MVGGSTWGTDGGITLIRSTREVAVKGDAVALSFSYHLTRDPGALLGEIDAGFRPGR